MWTAGVMMTCMTVDCVVDRWFNTAAYVDSRCSDDMYDSRLCCGPLVQSYSLCGQQVF